jgi:hypothetical protein
LRAAVASRALCAYCASRPDDATVPNNATITLRTAFTYQALRTALAGGSWRARCALGTTNTLSTCFSRSTALTDNSGSTVLAVQTGYTRLSISAVCTAFTLRSDLTRLSSGTGQSGGVTEPTPVFIDHDAIANRHAVRVNIAARYIIGLP